jgi:GNAT superfamily N-acetyltransferase
MTTTCTLRPAVRADAATLARHRYFRAQERVEDLAAYATWAQSRLDAGAYLGWVAEDGGQVVAGAGAVLLDWGPSRGDPTALRARVVNVFTEPAWRRRGLAKALVARVLDQSAALGIKTFSLASTDEGASLYASLGFLPYPAERLLKRP